jgi:hypothetical protein
MRHNYPSAPTTVGAVWRGLAPTDVTAVTGDKTGSNASKSASLCDPAGQRVSDGLYEISNMLMFLYARYTTAVQG